MKTVNRRTIRDYNKGIAVTVEVEAYDGDGVPVAVSRAFAPDVYVWRGDTHIIGEELEPDFVFTCEEWANFRDTVESMLETADPMAHHRIPVEP